MLNFDVVDPRREPPKVVQKLPDAVKEQVDIARQILVEAPPAFEFMTANPSTNKQLEREIIKLTAMFVASNGRNFFMQLMGREAHTSQFEFMKPVHPDFPYFTGLIEQYTKVILAPKTIVDDLQKALDYDTVLKSLKFRAAWQKHQNALEEQKQLNAEKEQDQYDAIDWHDFVVVQTIGFDEPDLMDITQSL